MNIGILAHVDAGKTTLTEQLLKLSGGIRTAGRVDAGTAHTDRTALEKARGISIKTACAPFFRNGRRINIVDAPGHADFSSEIERALWVVDAAVLVISGTDGVQPQTELMYKQLKRRGLPFMVFINKLDRDTADFGRVLAQAQKVLGAELFDINDSAEKAAELNDELLEPYLEGSLTAAQVHAELTKAIAALTAVPVFGGSALSGEGIERLADGLAEYLPEPAESAEGPLSGVVFALEQGGQMGTAAWVRLFSGTLHTRDSVNITLSHKNAYGSYETSEERKISCIRAVGVDGIGKDVTGLCAGEIGVLYGLTNVHAGQVIGMPPRGFTENALKTPLYFASVSPKNPAEREKLACALETLSAEDPMLEFSREDAGLNIRLMGAVQLEVIQSELKTRFGLDTEFGKYKVVYRETIRCAAEGFVAYTMPKPCWAIIKLEITPAPRGSGITFESVTPAREIKWRYQHQIRQAIPTAAAQGMLGWQVDDVHIKLVGGGDHEIHTHPLDFIVATPMAFMDGLRRGGSVLLEPIMRGELTFPDECAARVIGEITAMRGRLEDSISLEGKTTLKCVYPAAEAGDLPQRFARLTSGRGSMSSYLKGYEECELTEDKIRPRRGVNPLDTAKYILAARNALDGGIFD